ncbi:MAG TPA: twin-arginine translocation signal domain-containing protein, partial [Planctomycetaceae bacterium]|nr:twin-arginine translocation signal domain-containing protein [Planctomycetaceae bacterium]HIQ23337.1 twin-arginine translocation signal domain-containing protein [Planctomycetota bacterium]
MSKAGISRRKFLHRGAAAAVAAPWFVPSHVMARAGQPGA